METPRPRRPRIPDYRVRLLVDDRPRMPDPAGVGILGRPDSLGATIPLVAVDMRTLEEEDESC